jgi:tetratricopeptide (TPR) repeat protein
LEAAHPGDLNVEWSLGSALIHAGRPIEGIKRVVTVAEQGHSADANFLAADTYLAIGEFERAHVFAEEALKLDPKRKGLYSLNGRIKQYLGDFPGSKADLEKALTENPDDFDAHVTMAAILNLERDVDGAQRHAKKALDLRPNSPLARYQVARVERSRGDIEAAVRDRKGDRRQARWLRPHIELAGAWLSPTPGWDGKEGKCGQAVHTGQKLGPDADR